MKRCILVLLALLLVVPVLSVTPTYAEGISVSGMTAALLNAQTGELVYGKQADVARGMASTTKIMTGLLAVEALAPDARIAVAAEAVGTEGSSIYLQKGETLTAEALIYGLMLESANDAAVALACAVSGSVEAFVARMNARAAELGLVHTHFDNPHGLYTETHVTTARELALLTAHALKNPTFAKIVSTERRVFAAEDGSRTRVFRNHNRLLREYPDCIGVKTGFTKKTGRCLVSAARRGAVQLIAVTLGAPDDWRDHKTMLDFGFSLYETKTLAVPGQFSYTVPVVGGETDTIACQNIDGLSIAQKTGGKEVQVVIELARFYYAPVAAGEAIGAVAFYQNNQRVGQVLLYATESASQKTYPKGFWEKLLEFF